MSGSDSDVVRWGLDFLDADSLFNSHYGDNNQGEVYVYNQWHNGYNNTDTGCSNVENDEIIAHALQEEFSQLTISEEQPLQASSDTATDWLSSRNYYSGYGDMGPSSSSSSPEKSYGGEEYYHNLEITDESPLDGEVCKRLNQLIPVPHVPRINGDIPSTDEETSDYQRLVDRHKIFRTYVDKSHGDKLSSSELESSIRRSLIAGNSRCRTSGKLGFLDSEETDADEVSLLGFLVGIAAKPIIIYLFPSKAFTFPPNLAIKTGVEFLKVERYLCKSRGLGVQI
ncbi:hypothetical protein RHSIM_Rhsim03G0093100 [Rhododendron simsii]|uniref:Uncharacterized protein n=1 Tax=Rhododendron simsii TaxID=118357 RepID=A0A834LR70_RHOSS|nr:hypothetical protein RHSIM_Rhsim03G0093100 [Rhododendron simsii]